MSPSGRMKLSGSWPVMRLWELEAEKLLAADDVGLIPWLPLAHTNMPPEEVLSKCRDRLEQMPDKRDRESLLVVTQIMAGLAYPKLKLLELMGGEAMLNIESPVLDEIKEQLLKKYRPEFVAEGKAEGKGEGIALGTQQA